ncbi:MAG: virulence factor protein [Deltaproteobacteria bacterium]|nr:virulence factor protein [Deltaproteobacteria bacterium]
MEEQKTIAKAAGIVGGATFLSRIFGFIRDMIVAQFFGAGMATDAFFVAFRIPNLLRRLVGEGALTVSFIPIYTEYITRRPPEEGRDFVRATFSVLAVFLFVLTGLGILLAPWIVKVMAYGFSQDPEKLGLTVFLTRLMFPYIFFIGLVALAMGILNSWKHFFAPALAPVLLNLSIILCALVFYRFLAEPILSLALGVLLGGIAQLAFQLPFLRRKGYVFGFRFEPSHPGVKRIAALMAPSVLGLAVTQLNVLVSTFLASYLPEGSVSYLYYADRLLEFPMGIFAIAVATAVLPVMSEQAARKDWGNLRETLSFALRLVFFVTLPAMIGLIVLRQPILNLLFQRGAFTAHSAEMTAQALLYYSLGLAGFAGVRIIVPAFYSLQDTKTPVKIAFAALLANAILGALLMGPLQHGGLALATSLAAGINFALLVFLLRKKMGKIGLGKIVRSFFKSLGASLLMGAVALIISLQGEWQQSGVTPEKIALLGGAIVAAIAVYGVTSFFLGSEELQLVMAGVRKRFKIQKR